MGPFLRALATVGASVLLLPAFAAARPWSAAVPYPDGSIDWSAALAPLPAAGAILVYARGGGGLAARIGDAGGSFGDEELLADSYGGPPAVGGDDAGETVVAWDDWQTGAVRAGVRGADGNLAATTSFPAAPTYAAPGLSVSPGGWAALAFPAETPDGQRMFVSVKPPGGSFAPAQQAAPTTASDAQVPGTVAIDDGGEVVVGYLQGGVAHAAVRTAGALGTWQPAQTLGAPYLDPSPAAPLPLVAIAADGGAVAVWEQGGGPNLVAPVWASFRPPGGSFGPPQDLGVDTWDGAAPQLAVSALGEAILVVSPAIQEAGGIGQEPLAVVSGSTALGRFGASEQLSDTWPEAAGQLAMNARGDAVVAYEACCPERLETRRRAPFGAFASEQDVPLPTSPGGYYTEHLSHVVVDPFGNAAVTWIDYSSPVAQRLSSVDSPVLTSVPDVVPPASGQPTDLIPAPIAAAAPPALDPAPAPAQGYGPCTACFLTPPGFTWWPFSVPAVAPAPDTTAPPASTRPSRTPDGPLALAAPRLPAATGTPRIVVAVRCPWACRASVSASLVTPQHRRLLLPRAVLTADAAGVVTAPLRLTPAAARALKVGSGLRRVGTPSRRFTLNLTASAGDRTGAPQTVSVRLSFVRR